MPATRSASVQVSAGVATSLTASRMDLPSGLGVSELLATLNARDGRGATPHRSVVPIESSIPPGMTCETRGRDRLRRQQLPAARLLAAGYAACRLALGAAATSTRAPPATTTIRKSQLPAGVPSLRHRELVHRQPYEPVRASSRPRVSREAIGFAGSSSRMRPIKPGPGGSRSWAVRLAARGANGSRAW
jgi:hypothetical protein